jgi:pentatricopeptide repeat protein
MLEDGITLHPALYCTLLSAAGRSANLGLARHLYQHMAVTLNLPPAAAVETTGLIPAVQEGQQQQQHQLQQQLDAAPTALVDGGANSSSTDTDADGDAPNMMALVNALLFAHAQVGALHGALAIYKQELLGRGLAPDAYTCTALLTAAARLASGSLSWAQVVQIVDVTHHFHIRLTTQLGTSLINAYRRVRTWAPMQEEAFGDAGSLAESSSSSSGSSSAGGRGSVAVTAAEAEHQQRQREAAAAWGAQQLAAIGARALVGVPPVVAASLHAARQVLSALQEYNLATSNSYVTMLCFLLEQGQIGAFKQLFGEMTEQHGIFPAEHGWEKLAYAAAEAGAGAMLEQLQERFQGQQQQQPGRQQQRSWQS